MFVIAVVNRKGGCGKSTLATHLAVHLSTLPQASVQLCDLDPQQSATAWMRRRESAGHARPRQLRCVSHSARQFSRPQGGASHLVLDTPAGLDALELARIVMAADLVVVPVRDALFDRLAAEDTVAELRRLPRVAQQRCRLAALEVGEDNDDADDAAPPAGLAGWAQDQGLPWLGGLRHHRRLGRLADQGLCLLDEAAPAALASPRDRQDCAALLQRLLQDLPVPADDAPAPPVRPLRPAALPTRASAPLPTLHRTPAAPHPAAPLAMAAVAEPVIPARLLRQTPALNPAGALRQLVCPAGLPTPDIA
ncbi:ParA family protein [Ideonella livida]|uniref:ParA family protein n=1 Tax=Ideonella livida TaxID=2707176 RepID=A0A7C9TN19_9BURK|nr:ParA family protein [Ideonella livida]NDY93423.1 ParA family protein [Ideonella livida]